METLFNLINIHILLTGVLNGKLKKGPFIILFSLILLPSIAISFFPQIPIDTLITSILCMAFIYLIPLFTVSGLAKTQMLYVSLFYVGLTTALITPGIWIVSALDLNLNFWYLIELFIHIMMLTLCILMAKGRLFTNISQIILIPMSQKIILLLAIWSSTFVAYFLSQLFDDYRGDPMLLVIQLLCAALVIMIGVICPLWIAGSISSIYYRTLSSAAEKQIQRQIHQYEVLTQADYSIRKFRHDFKHLRLSLARNLELDNKEEALRCLKEFDKPFEIDYISFSTGNPVADALLSEKKTMADKSDIQLSFKGAIPPKGISATDLCVILGNALDNALEACEKIEKAHEKRWISVEAYAENNFFFLSIRNSIQEDVPVKGNAIATTKTDKASHGFGLHSIQTTIKRYGGDMELRSGGGVFEMNISLDLMDE